MHQKYLNPGDLKNEEYRNSIIETWTPNGPLNPETRNLGYYPNINDWNPGDLILTSSIKPNIICQGITNAQLEGGYNETDSMWHHVAIYLGRDDICEADGFKGVINNELSNYVTGKHILRVRRPLDISREQGCEIAIAFQKNLGAAYSFNYLFELIYLTKRGLWKRRKNINNTSNLRAIICSQVYANAYSQITGKTLINDRAYETTPACLSCDKNRLKDIYIRWIKIQ